VIVGQSPTADRKSTVAALKMKVDRKQNQAQMVGRK